MKSIKHTLLKHSQQNYGLVNIGDHIQSCAAEQFMPKIDFYTERDKLNMEIKNPVKVILNGDYDVSCYLDQAHWCEHEINDLYKRYDHDPVQLNEHSKIWKARRTRLIEDHDREEHEKLTAIRDGFFQNFQITKDEIQKEMLNCRGSLIDLYYIIEEKYKIKYVKHEKRGRPKKIT